MFFFFEDENNSKAAYLAFETYVIETLQKYAQSQGKRVIVNNESNFFDAILPDGIDDISESLNVEIKYFTSDRKSVYFQSLQRLTNKINQIEDGALLLILGADFTDKSIESMFSMLKSRTNKKIFIWTLATFNEKTKD